MGFVAPMIVGFIINGQNDVDHWKLVFWISTAVYSVGSLAFIVLGSSEEQKWNRVKMSRLGNFVLIQRNIKKRK